MADPGPDIVTGSDGRQKYRLHCELEWAYPFDPNSPLTLLWAPPGGIGEANLPFMLKGNNGFSATIQSAERTLLEYDDPTPDSYELVELSPATDEHGQILKLVTVEHKGAPGTNGTSTLDPNAYGSKVAGRILELYLDGSDWKFRYTAPKVCGLHWATSVNAAPDGTTAGFTVGQVDIAANTYPYAVRVIPIGGTVTTGSSADVVVDLIARLNGTSGVVVGRCPGIGGATDRLTLAGVPDPGALSADVTIAANAAASVYFRTEKQSGTATYLSSAAATRCGLLVVPA